MGGKSYVNLHPENDKRKGTDCKRLTWFLFKQICITIPPTVIVVAGTKYFMRDTCALTWYASNPFQNEIYEPHQI